MITQDNTYFEIILGSIRGFVHISGECELSRPGDTIETSTSGRGTGDLHSLRIVWAEMLSWAETHGIDQLYCEPTMIDGRGATRERVYSRVGFIKNGPFMVLKLRRKS